MRITHVNPAHEGDNAYVAPVLAMAPRLLGLLDREPASLTNGSADREYWGWKFRDYPISMLQAVVYPLALLWAHPFQKNPFHHSPLLLEWILASFRHTLSRQRANGSFDAYSPNDQDPGVTLGIPFGLMSAHRLLQSHFPAELEQGFRRSVRACCDFALNRSESHAFISNHQALFALAWLNASELLNEPRFRQSADKVIEEILHRQAGEGWYEEYGGFDAGYESLGIHYLALYYQRTGEARLLDSLRRSVRFFWHFVHPDGSVGGVYGSRHTSLYFPGGFEILAAEIPEAAVVAGFMRERLALANVVTPATTDAHNLAPLMSSYLTAALVNAPRTAAPLPLPCQQMQGIHHFPESGLSVAATPAYYAVASARKGGVCRIFDRRTQTIAYEDAGYLVRSGARRWISQTMGLGHSTPTADSSVMACEAQFAAYQQPIPTPLRFVILRLMNLTLFRSVALGALIRKWIIGLLITGRRPGPLRLRRTLLFEPDAVSFVDEIELQRPMPIDEVTRPRSLTGIHMGSAKYFHPSELVETPQAPVEHMARDLNRTGRAICTFVLRFCAEGGVMLHFGQPAVSHETPVTVGQER